MWDDEDQTALVMDADEAIIRGGVWCLIGRGAARTESGEPQRTSFCCQSLGKCLSARNSRRIRTGSQTDEIPTSTLIQNFDNVG